MIAHAKNQLDLAYKNMASLQDVDSWDDFMSWYNRQLYLERASENAWNNINVTVGKKQYHITQIEDMAYAAKENYGDYWDKEFTDEQRREIWKIEL